jgi:hypothetical protein
MNAIGKFNLFISNSVTEDTLKGRQKIENCEFVVNFVKYSSMAVNWRHLSTFEVFTQNGDLTKDVHLESTFVL